MDVGGRVTQDAKAEEYEYCGCRDAKDAYTDVGGWKCLEHIS